MANPKISIIIPVPPNGSAEKPVNSIKKAGYPKEFIEVLLVFGKQPSVQRNRAVEKAAGEILYFADSDVAIEKNNLSLIVENFEKKFCGKNVAVVGGPVLSDESANFLQKCFAVVFSSFFAMGKSRSRFAKVGEKRIACEEDLILANFAVKKSVFDELGGFNERLYPNEENEFMNRLLEKGHLMLYDPQIAVYRLHKKNLEQFVRAFFSYGRGRAEHFLAKPKFFKPFYLIPSIFLLYLLSLFFFASDFSQNFIFFLPLAAYVFIDFSSSIFGTIRAKFLWNFLPAFFAVALLFPIIHVLYGIGFLYGCTKTSLKIGGKKNINVEIKMVKT